MSPYRQWRAEVLEATCYAFTEGELEKLWRAGESAADVASWAEDQLDDDLFGAEEVDA
jgi:hypothetical protein